MADSQKKTANLFDKDNNIVNYYLASTNGAYQATSGMSRSIKLKINPSSVYSITLTSYTKRIGFFENEPTDNDVPVAFYNNDTNEYSQSSFTITAPASANYMVIFCYNASKEYTEGKTINEVMSSVMVNIGSTALPYEPYWQHSLRKLTTATEAVENPLYSDGTAITSYTIKGNTVQNGTPTPSAPIAVQGVGELDSGQYKIPISSGGVTTNVYLGSTQTVRKIGQLIFDGTENWELLSINSYGIANFRLSIPADDASMQGGNTAYCTHYEQQQSLIADTTTEGFLIAGSNPSTSFYIRAYATDYDTKDKFKAYLAAQYSNNTPVTIYYQYYQAHTGAYNRPLYKIASNADTLSNATSIPTTEGANTITVDTTVQPSEFTATWTGWHDASVKEKSENLFDYTTMADGVVGKYLNANGTTTDDSRFTITDYIPCDTNTVTLYRGTLNNQPAICCYDENKNYITGISYNAQDPITLTASQRFKYVRFSWKNSTHTEPDVLTAIMLNTGSTALPYEPYWK